MEMIYLDNAATTLKKPPQVAQAVVRAMETLGNSARGAHRGTLDASRVIYGAREKLAQLLGCPRADHVVFTANVTEALNIAICGLVARGDRVVTTAMEHNSVLRPLYALEKSRNIDLAIASADRQGRLDYGELERMVRPGTRLVVCTHASNLTGNVTDIRRVSQIAHRAGSILVVDAAQTAGSRPVDMLNMGADVLCFTGHKGLMGPQGTGGLCIREGVEIRPFKSGGTGVQTYLPEQPPQYPTRLEAGTLNGHGIAGLSAAVDWIMKTGLDQIEARETELTRRFYKEVVDLPGVTVYGDFFAPHAAIVALNIGDRDSGEVADRLAEDYGIAVRAGAHCAPRMHEALGTREQGAVRFSFSWFTTEEEIDAAIRAVRELANEK
jgi:cysteine desulfurase family protein